MTKKISASQKKSKRYKRLFFTGASMGLADLVPGVSGGTIAFLYGIYDELIFSVKQITGVIPKLLLKGKFKEAWKELPVSFLAPLFIGIAISIFGLSKAVTYLIENYPIFIWSLFLGLVIGSSVVITKRVSTWNYKRIILLLVGAVATYFLIGLSEQKLGNTPIILFISGMIGFCAMILPGISGSLLLLIMGQYHYVIQAVSDRNFLILFYVGAGGIVGLSIFSRLLSWLLKHHHGATVAVLIGIMIGSIRKVWPWQMNGNPAIPEININLLIGIVMTVIGFLIIIYLEKAGIAKEHTDIDNKEFIKEVKEAQKTA